MPSRGWLPGLAHSGASSMPTAPAPIVADDATLPVIRAAGFEVRVNAYVVGRTRRVVGVIGGRRSGSTDGESSPGCQGGMADLWYLSLVGARGQGTTLRALWANLVSNHNRAVWLEGIGSVMLGQHRLDLADLGYPIPWTYRQAVLMPSRDVQGVLESDLLTCHDPLLIPGASRALRRRSDHASAARSGRDASHGRIAAPVPGSHQGAGSDTSDHAAVSNIQGRGGEGAAAARAGGRDGGVTLSTASGSGEEAHAVAAREARPLFLLLARGTDDADRASLPRLHLCYLAARIPWLPYYPAWADYLWQRARERREAEELTVWCYGMPKLPMAGPHTGSGASGPTSGEPGSQAGDNAPPRPVLTSAYLCKPDPLALTEDLRRAIAGSRFSSLSARKQGTTAERAA